MGNLISENLVDKKIGITGNDNIGITGDNNVAFMFNGVNYNISIIYNELIHQISQVYRLDLIRVHFVSIFLVLTIILIVIRCFVPQHRMKKCEII
jgi:hypothetical protein